MIRFGTHRLWCPETQLVTLPGFQIDAFAVSPDGKRIALGDATIVVRSI